MFRSALAVAAAAALVISVHAQTPPAPQAPQAPMAPAAPLGPNTWSVDGNHTAAQFSVKHLLVSTVRGTLGKVSGTIDWDGKTPESIKADISIDVNGINTGTEGRDKDLRSPNFFDVAQFPTVTFKSKKVERVSDGKYKVTGDLTMRGVTHEVVLDVEGSPTPMKDPMGNTKLGGVAKTTLNRQDFGINWSKSLDGGGLVVGNDVDVIIDVELTRK